MGDDMSTVDEKIDRLILMVEHMDQKFEDKFDSIATEQIGRAHV